MEFIFRSYRNFKYARHISIRVLSLIFIISIAAGNTELNGQRLSRDLNVSLMVNQAGYLPQAGKFCITKGEIKRNFEVIELETQKVVWTGILQPSSGDFGEYSVGDFSTLTREGHFYIRSDTIRSYPFEISHSIYQSPMDLIVHYFSRQRCGSSTTGYLSPCHLDDGVRLDNGKHQDVTGGWHDASDLRKWVGATQYGMIGLAKAYYLQPEQNRDKILEELMWGNRYFLKMQEPQGYVMSHIGGEIQQDWDNNRWTDNEIGKDEGELRIVVPNAGETSNEVLVFGTKDDRIIQTDPLGMLGQYNFIMSEALMARITKTIDSDYSQKCLRAAINCFEWCVKSDKDTNPGIIGAAIQASIELYKTTNQDIYKNFAIEQASLLKKLQATHQEGNVSGFFYTSFSDQEPYKNIWNGCLDFISLCDLIQTFPLHDDVSSWKDMLANYTHHYLLFMSQRNNFGIIPYGLYSAQDPGGNRKTGDYWYRYFMVPDGWWVGINANLASMGIGLVKAAEILNDQGLAILAQRQLDWIIGVNPFNSSTMVGVGYNHPPQFTRMTRAFKPGTPVIPGAVMNGLGGDHSDQPIIGDGIYHISEYWTPMCAYTLWLMAELSKSE